MHVDAQKAAAALLRAQHHRAAAVAKQDAGAAVAPVDVTAQRVGTCGRGGALGGSRWID